MDWFVAIVVCLGLVILVSWWGRRSSARNTRELLAPRPVELDATPDTPGGFGYKMSWLALRTDDPLEVINVLGLTEVKRANWHTGCLAAYNNHTFVSPPVDGWVFVVTWKTPSIESELEDWQSMMEALSERFEDTQNFGTHRVSNFVAWARYQGGHEIRAFAFADDVIINRGSLTDEEQDLSCCDFLNEEYVDMEPDELDEWDFPCEEHVFELAGAWSLNPIEFSDMDRPKSVGWVGRLL